MHLLIFSGYVGQFLLQHIPLYHVVRTPPPHRLDNAGVDVPLYHFSCPEMPPGIRRLATSDLVFRKPRVISPPPEYIPQRLAANRPPVTRGREHNYPYPVGGSIDLR